MTIRIEVSCDAHNCSNTTEIEELDDIEIMFNGWHTHPEDEDQHFCPGCWPSVKQELEERGIETDDQANL